jgi:glycosyltransferase involved in cell wall biosynthesis
MQIIIVTDAWFPQVNGVVRTLATLKAQLESAGHSVTVIGPNQFRTIPCPSYPEIRLALCRSSSVGRMIDRARPGAIHIATEGPLGLLARRHCLRTGASFTTSFHTRFPEYIDARWGIPIGWTYRYLRWFHRPADAVMVSTASIEDDLLGRGFGNLKRWSRGVDTSLFRPRTKDFLPYPRPISLFVGRVAIEKNIEDFLRLDLPGSKVVVGDGPLLNHLRRRYADVHFVGVKEGEELARYYAAADVFVFPSRTDTFGLVLLEALASGVPVAAYPVPGPLDILEKSGAGVLDEDLRAAVVAALSIPPARCRAYAETFSWEKSVMQFLSNLSLLPVETTPRVADA